MGKLIACLARDGAFLPQDVMARMTRQSEHVNPDRIVDRQPGRQSLHARFAGQSTPDVHAVERDGGRLRLVADARIDNRDELLEQLDMVETHGPLVTDSDLILGAWKKWGQECPVHLIGDFAFVLWSEIDQLLLAACDPMNMRTLYYAQLGSVLWLATEARRILRHRDVPVELDEVFLARQLIGWPDHNGSVYKGIERLPAGHTLVARDGNPILVRRYWDIDPARTIRYRRIHEYADHFRELLSRCVSDRLRTDGVVASEMSGGLDSTTVTALATRHLRSRNTVPLVISHRYPGIPSLDETTLIGAMAKHLNVEPHFVDVESWWNPLTDYVPLVESPGNLVSPLLYREMELAARAGAKVLLSGIGGDEATWGHPLIFAHRVARGDLSVVRHVLSYGRANKLPLCRHLYTTLLRPLLPGRMVELSRGILRRPKVRPWPGWFPDATAVRLGIPAYPLAARDQRFPNRALQRSYDLLMEGTSIGTVRGYHHVASEHGIEARHPFLDRRIAEFVLAVPVSLFNRDGWPKWLLRQASRDLLPEAVLRTPKKTAVGASWAIKLRGRQVQLRTMLAAGALERLELVDMPRLLEELLDLAARGDAADTSRGRWIYPLSVQRWLARHHGQTHPDSATQDE